MGQWFSKFFLGQGFEVTICDINPKSEAIATELGARNEEDINLSFLDSDIVMISVPIGSVEDVMKKVAPKMKTGSLLMEIASVKKDVSEAMKRLETNSIEMIGIHPMFGPSTLDMKNQLVIVIPVKGDKWTLKIRQIFEDFGARTEILSAEKHDEIMAVVQGLTHFTYIAIGSTIKNLDFDISQSRKYMSPIYEIMMDFVGRILGQDACLYATIQMNPNIDQVRGTFISQCEYLSDLLKQKNIEKFVKEMECAADHFKDTDSALKRSNELLEYRLKQSLD